MMLDLWAAISSRANLYLRTMPQCVYGTIKINFGGIQHNTMLLSGKFGSWV